MNKAFLREQDESVRHCPACGSLGQPVEPTTLNHWLAPEARREISDRSSFCPFPTCPVAYFDGFERTVGIDKLLRPAWPKDPDASICGCFGLTTEDIEDDIADGGVVRLKAHHAQARSAAARCQEKSPCGQSCITEVQRYYFRRTGPPG